MSLLTIIIVLVVVGIVLWAINAYVPMDAKVRTLLNIVIIIFLVIWLLKAFGVWGELSKVKVENRAKEFELVNSSGGSQVITFTAANGTWSNIVIGEKPGGYFTEFNLPDDPGTVIRPK